MFKRYITYVGTFLAVVLLCLFMIGPAIAAAIVVFVTQNAWFWLLLLGELITFPLAVAWLNED